MAKAKKKVAKKATKKPAVKKAAKKAAASVRVKVSGGEFKTMPCQTLGELKESLDAANYQALVDGETENNNDLMLKDGQIVTLTAPVKGS